MADLTLKAWRRDGPHNTIMTIEWTKRCGFLWLRKKTVTAHVIGEISYWYMYPSLKKCAVHVDLGLFQLWKAIDMGLVDHLEIK